MIWYRLVACGNTPQYMRMVARENWASYDRFNRSVVDLLANDEVALLDFADAAQVSNTDSWRYRAELSNLP
ncbi:hypothetical protein [Dyella subtropica]|uniref:hypothetical protein n=1 Tax=Dyella subtropica TaxID=2992127 RepID=UPI002255C1FD|nr:hypothetical protein [Dyella subtropica]